MIKIWENGRRKYKKYRKEWAILGKHQIEDINWRKVLWTRPYKIETIWEMLAHTRNHNRRILTYFVKIIHLIKYNSEPYPNQV